MIAFSVKRCSKKEALPMDSFTDVPNPLPNMQHFKVPFPLEESNEDISKDGAITVQYARTLTIKILSTSRR